MTLASVRLGGFEIALQHCREANEARIKREAERRSTLVDLDKVMDEAIGQRTTATGVSVTNNTALNCVPYFAGVRLYAETMGQVPLIEYRRLARGKERATDQAVYYLLHDEPNPEMSAQSMKEALEAHKVSWGNAFAEIDWDMDSGVPRALWPLRPDKMQVGRDSVTKKLIYVYTLPDGQKVILPDWRVWHMPGVGFDGIIGYDSVYLAREAIGMAMAMEEYGARFFSNGAAPSGVLEHPNKLSKEAQDRLRGSWNEMHQGLSNQHRIAILEEGMSYKQVGIAPENAQLFQARSFQIEEMARLLNLPPHMLRDLTHATFSNIEFQSIDFVRYSMEPSFIRWAQTSNRKLLTPEQKRQYFVEALPLSLLRGDSAARAAYFRERFYIGSLTPNEIRDLENENPLDDPNADKAYVQANMRPIDQADEPQQQESTLRSFEPLFQDAAKRVADRERQNILRQLKKNADVTAWLPEFYRDFRAFVEGQVEPVVRACAEVSRPLNPEGWVTDKTRVLASRYVEDSQRNLESIPTPNLEAVLTNWDSQRRFTLTGII